MEEPKFGLDTAPPKCVIVFAILLTILPLVGALLLSLAVKNYALCWLKTLKIPSYAPPRWSEAPAWTIVYCAIGYASFLVYREGNGFRGCAQIPLTLYVAQLLLNWGFIPLFFARHKLKCSFYEILLLDITATTCAVSFYLIKPIAGLLFIPYILWHVYETIVTYAIYRDNYQSGLKRLINEEILKPELIIDNDMKK
ncbi:translocator protein-like [Chrysoperla carnea]|uniref:translocator protein-like n=1 Tax=Chrysoperla carnea TaxID=189513 RepID=UPI001D08322F|nr:translocator protein-like [Chrysoperla carnea]